jgi:parvulin-like peptidyl-prolyl isomerase
MKKILFVLLILGMAVTSFAMDKVVAKVNGQNIYESEVKLVLSQFLARNGMTLQQVGYNNPQLRNFKMEILNKLIDRELLYALASQNVPADIDKKVDEYIINMKKEYKSDLEFQQEIEKTGSNYNEFKERIKKNMIIDEYIKSLSHRVNITDEEIEKFYKDNFSAFNKEKMVRASHILIEVKNGMDDMTAKEKIDKIYKEAKANPGAFAELAKKYSTGPSGPSGGDLGYFRERGDMIDKFSDVAFAMKVGEISKPIKTKFGYHIIKVTDIKPPQKQSLDEVKHKIRAILTDEKVKNILQEELDKVRKKSKIEINM